MSGETLTALLTISALEAHSMAYQRKARRISARKAAIAAGETFYVPEVPCARCGTSLRYTGSGSCLACIRTPEKRAAGVARAAVWRAKKPVTELRAYRAKERRDWRKRDPERAKASDKRKREAIAADSDKLQKRQAIMRAWRDANHEHVTAYDNAIKAQWRKDNPEAARMKGRLARQRRRALDLNAEGTFSEQDVIDLMVAQDGICATCPADISEKYEIDHMMPLSRGGTHWPTNLQLLCENCNSQKWAMTQDEWLARRAADALR